MGDSQELEALRKALEASERRFQDLVETSHHLIWSVDAAGCWTYLNREPARRIYGRDPGELLGRPFAEVVAPERLERDLAAFEEIKEGRELYDHETVHLHADGRRIPLRFNAIMLRDETGDDVALELAGDAEHQHGVDLVFEQVVPGSGEEGGCRLAARGRHAAGSSRWHAQLKTSFTGRKK